MNKNILYVNLRGFSVYSIQDSVCRIPQMIDISIKKNTSIAICDRMNFFGALQYSQYAIKNKMKPILGCLIEVQDYGELPFFAKTKIGYQKLSYYISKSYVKDKTITLKDLHNFQDVICLSGSESFAYKSISTEEKIQKIKNLYQIFKEDFFIELQGNYNELLQIALQLNIATVATSNIYFPEAENSLEFYFIQQMKNNNYFNQEEYENSNLNHNYIKSYEEICKKYPQEAIDNTVNIYKKCNFFIEKGEIIIPNFIYNNKILNYQEENDLLKGNIQILLEKFLQKKELSEHAIYHQRLKKEMGILCEKNFCGYFLITQDFIQFAKQQNIPWTRKRICCWILGSLFTRYHLPRSH